MKVHLRGDYQTLGEEVLRVPSAWFHGTTIAMPDKQRTPRTSSLITSSTNHSHLGHRKPALEMALRARIVNSITSGGWVMLPPIPLFSITSQAALFQAVGQVHASPLMNSAT